MRPTAEPDYVSYEGLRLPPPGMTRHGGKTDAHYVRSAKQMVERVSELAGLDADSRVLDIGCGAGRFLTGLLASYGRFERYVGLDVRRPVMEWASRTLTDAGGCDATFHWLDVANERYNRRGTSPAGDEILPVGDHEFDIVLLWSVFSHLTAEDTAIYLPEIRRVLASGGRCYCTLFVEDGVPDWEENPSNYIQPWSGRLHCVRFNRAYFERLVSGASLGVKDFRYRNNNGRQSTYVLAPT